jgi:hypothetical protein
MRLTPVASNGFYDIGVSSGQNRIFITLQGSWVKYDQVANWLQDVKSAIRLVTPGFTVWYDVTRLKGSLQIHLWVDAHQALMKAGMKKVAEIHDAKGSVAAKAQVEAADQESGFPVTRFTDRVVAEAWLDR